MLILAWLDGTSEWFPGQSKDMLPFTWKTSQENDSFFIDFYDNLLKEKCGCEHERFGLKVYENKWIVISFQSGKANEDFAKGLGLIPVKSHLKVHDDTVTCTHDKTPIPA
jgi:hypothetical protein